ncbi:group I truncated hemoglobin [Crenobacter cavernae]|uniref:Group 1 truncated hemoglobin n=1 Tax=Crenobacter cavernae TaxID=2290923 RepID=A0A345Y7K0_9NEIS|nr:group 1 truncated hemoglobin [Crenobacter cavernae]AXK39902.1 group 1 truncated hemoglobin [Crenobacter cavernae]
MLGAHGSVEKPSPPNRCKETKIKNNLRVALTAMAFLLAASFAPVASAQQPEAQKLLYDRLGGLKGITVVVDDFINRLVSNKTLNKNPAINAGRKSAPAPYLKFQVSQLVCEVSGGPCKYTGKTMKESHAHLNISEKEWDVMVKDFKKSLDKDKVPAVEQKELFDIVGKTKADIVVRK